MTPREDAGQTFAPPVTDRDSGFTEIEGEVPEGISGACGVDSNKVFELTVNDKVPGAIPLAVDLQDSRFGVAFVDASEECLDQVVLAEITGPARTGPPEVISAVDECSSMTDPAIARTSAGWLIGVADNREGNDLWVHAFDPADPENTEVHRITDSATVPESRTAIGALLKSVFNTWDEGESVEISTAAMLAWVETEDRRDANNRFEGTTTRLKVRPLKSSGEPNGDEVIIEESDNQIFDSLAVSQIGEDKFALAYLRWQVDGPQEAVLQILDQEGGTTKGEWVLTNAAGQTGTVDLATDEKGGGVVYTMVVGSTGREVWMQPLDENGNAEQLSTGIMDRGPAPARRLVSGPFRAEDVSLARMPTGVGFAVSYRQLPDSARPDAKIRVLFLDRLGSLVGNSDLAFTTEVGGRTTIESSYDGRFTVAFGEFTEAGENIVKVVKLPCAGGL